MSSPLWEAPFISTGKTPILCLVKQRQALITGVSYQYRSATLLASAPRQKSVTAMQMQYSTQLSVTVPEPEIWTE